MAFTAENTLAQGQYSPRQFQERVLPFQVSPWADFCAPLFFHTHCWYAVDICDTKVLQAVGSLWNTAFAKDGCSHPSSPTCLRRFVYKEFVDALMVHLRKKTGAGGSNRRRASPGDFAVRHAVR